MNVYSTLLAVGQIGEVTAKNLNWIGKLLIKLFTSVGSVGIAVVIFTLIVKAIVLPLDIFSRASTKKNEFVMKRMKPQLDKLKKQGFEYTLVPVDSEGYVSPDDIAAAIRPDTALVSVMYANNEIGTIQPIREISKVCHDKGALFHCDAVQAVGHIPVNVVDDGIDLMSVSAHKFHGPKGIGVLYVRKGVTLTNLIEGGAQERGRRAGTESVALASGMAAALEEACALMDERAARLSRIRDHIIDELLKIERSRVNGGREKRVPGNVSMCFEGVEGEALLLLLDFNGIAASSGSF